MCFYNATLTPFKTESYSLPFDLSVEKQSAERKLRDLHNAYFLKCQVAQPLKELQSLYIST